MAFKKESKIKSSFTKITIGLASPEEILANSYGEVFFVDTGESDESDGAEGSKLQKSQLPVLTGPIGMAQEMLGYFHQA